MLRFQPNPPRTCFLSSRLCPSVLKAATLNLCSVQKADPCPSPKDEKSSSCVSKRGQKQKPRPSAQCLLLAWGGLLCDAQAPSPSLTAPGPAPTGAQAGQWAPWGCNSRSWGAPFKSSRNSVSRKLGRVNGILGSGRLLSLNSVHIHFCSAAGHRDSQDL